MREIVQIVQCIETHAKHFLDEKKMMQIRARMSSTDRTAAIRVDRLFKLGYTAATSLSDPIMSPTRSFLRLALLLAVLLLAACGNKGPLVKPGAPATPAPTH